MLVLSKSDVSPLGGTNIHEQLHMRHKENNGLVFSS